MSTGPISLDYPSIPTKQIWKKHMERAPQDIRTYIINLFPILTWVHRYNFSVNIFSIYNYFFFLRMQYAYSFFPSSSGWFRMLLQESQLVCY
jgi:hypothetical protein